MAAASRAVVSLLVGIIWLYQRTLRWVVGPACRFHPTCSVYASVAITEYGAPRGLMLAARRLCRCHPWNPGGFDPLPQRRS